MAEMLSQKVVNVNLISFGKIYRKFIQNLIKVLYLCLAFGWTSILGAQVGAQTWQMYHLSTSIYSIYIPQVARLKLARLLVRFMGISVFGAMVYSLILFRLCCSYWLSYQSKGLKASCCPWLKIQDIPLMVRRNIPNHVINLTSVR